MKDTITLWLSRDNDWWYHFWCKKPIFDNGEWHVDGGHLYSPCMFSLKEIGISLKRGELMRFTGKKVKK